MLQVNRWKQRYSAMIPDVSQAFDKLWLAGFFIQKKKNHKLKIPWSASTAED